MKARFQKKKNPSRPPLPLPTCHRLNVTKVYMFSLSVQESRTQLALRYCAPWMSGFQQSRSVPRFTALPSNGLHMIELLALMPKSLHKGILVSVLVCAQALQGVTQLVGASWLAPLSPWPSLRQSVELRMLCKSANPSPWLRLAKLQLSLHCHLRASSTPCPIDFCCLLCMAFVGTG